MKPQPPVNNSFIRLLVQFGRRGAYAHSGHSREAAAEPGRSTKLATTVLVGPRSGPARYAWKAGLAAYHNVAYYQHHPRDEAFSRCIISSVT
jgi:hypothetical protein